MLQTQTVESSKVALHKIREAAKPSCRKCYGRGWIGLRHDNSAIVPCRCVINNLSKGRVKPSSVPAPEPTPESPEKPASNP